MYRIQMNRYLTFYDFCYDIYTIFSCSEFYVQHLKLLWRFSLCADLVKDPKQDTFAEKLVTNVIKNLEVKVTNIHVRYEDAYTDLAHPFSVGATLRELSCQTTDDNWKLAVIKEAASVIYKVCVRRRGLGVNMNVAEVESVIRKVCVGCEVLAVGMCRLKVN